MIDHVSVPVRILAASAAFYDAILAPLKLQRMVERPAAIGFGRKYPEFWLNLRPHLLPAPENVGMHICLRAPDQAAVEAFHALAIQHGGRSDGAPGMRQAAVTTYFGAFIRDPDGNKIEAVTFMTPGP